uniref:hypothetical protein n=1 Tax=Bacillus pumilus TaxID=1408 RepID=UPI001C92E5CA
WNKNEVKSVKRGMKSFEGKMWILLGGFLGNEEMLKEKLCVVCGEVLKGLSEHLFDIMRCEIFT